MNLEIVTPDKAVFSGDVDAIKLPGSEGSFGILNNHAPIIATLKEGQIEISGGEAGAQQFDIKGGVVEVLNNKVIVLAE